MAKVIQVIETATLRGHGVIHDRYRQVTEYWSLDGTLLAEVDPCAPRYFHSSADGDFTDAGWVIDRDDHIKKEKR